MSSTLNEVTLIGFLGRDPEVRTRNTGERIAHLSLATSESWTDREGKKQERTEWHRVVIFNDKIAGAVEAHMRKGSKLMVHGMLKTRKYQAQDGSDRYATEVVVNGFRHFVDFHDTSDRKGPPPAAGPEDYGVTRAYGGQPTPAQGEKRDFEFDDDIPF